MTFPLELPISTDALQAALPHRKPMVWIKTVIEATPKTGVCEVLLENGSHEFSPQGLRQSSVVEWMAQGFGFAHYCATGATPKHAFLVQIQNLNFCDGSVWESFSIAVKTQPETVKAFVRGKLVRTLGHISLVDTEAYYALHSNAPISIAKAQLKLFQSSEEQPQQ